MLRKSTHIFLYLMLLAIIVYSSACSSTNAQSTRPKPVATKTEESKSTYESPKRVSKDVIKTDDKPAKTKTDDKPAKTKTK